MDLVTATKATQGVMEQVIAPQVGRRDLALAVGYAEYAGTPVGNVTPNFIGERCFDTTNSDFYIAVALTNANWAPMSLDTLSAAELGLLDGVTAGASSPSKVLTTDAAESLVWTTTDATAGETVTLSIQDTRTAADATGWAAKGELVSNVALGAYANGLYGLMTFGESGRITGLAAGIVGEVELSAGTTQGTYAALEAELTANAAVSTGTDTAFIYGNIAGSNGTGKTTINTNAHLMVLGAGVVDTASGLWDAIGAQAVTASGCLRIKIGATLYYIPVCASAALTS